MGFVISPLSREGRRLRMMIAGISGSGKTWSALMIMRKITPGTILVLDTERSSSGLYAKEFNSDGRVFSLDMPDHSISTYREAMREAVKQGFGGIIIDSLSHSWMGRGGVLEKVDDSNDHSLFGPWKGMTKDWNEFVDEMLTIQAHLIATVRQKTAYAIDKNDRGKSEAKRVGVKIQQREGLEYEFDHAGAMDHTHRMTTIKTRIKLFDIPNAYSVNERMADSVGKWLVDGDGEHQGMAQQEISHGEAPDYTLQVHNQFNSIFEDFDVMDDRARKVFVRLTNNPLAVRDLLASLRSAGVTGERLKLAVIRHDRAQDFDALKSALQQESR